MDGRALVVKEARHLFPVDSPHFHPDLHEVFETCILLARPAVAEELVLVAGRNAHCMDGRASPRDVSDDTFFGKVSHTEEKSNVLKT